MIQMREYDSAATSVTQPRKMMITTETVNTSDFIMMIRALLCWLKRAPP